MLELLHIKVLVHLVLLGSTHLDEVAKNYGLLLKRLRGHILDYKEMDDYVLLCL